MKKIITIALVLSTPMMVFADIYKWTDDKGNIHITNNDNKVPEKYKNQIEKPLEKKRKIATEEGYLETIETPNSFEMTRYIKDDNYPTGYKIIKCFDSWKGNIKTTTVCEDLFNKMIKYDGNI